MANIKTREKNKGMIKTLDRVSIMNQHIKQASPRVKDYSFAGREESDSPEDYASGKVAEYSETIAGRAIPSGGRKARNIVNSKRQTVDVRTKKGMARRSTKAMGANGRAVGASTSSARKSYRTVARRGAIRTVPKRNAKKEMAKIKAAHKAQVRSRKAVQRAAREARRAAILTHRALRATISSAKALLGVIIAGGWISLVIILICILFGAAFYFFGDESSSNYIPVSPEVEAYTPVIEKYAEQHGIPEYVELIKAVMMQESGGKGNDPMQASEGPYNTKYPKKPNGITDPDYSIVCGVQQLASCLSQAKCSNPLDMEHIKLALQGYNYGNGYISWAINKDGGYTPANAIAFADEQAKKLKVAAYGDKQYVEHVLRYYPYGNYSYDIINTGPGKLGLPIQNMTQKNISSHFGPRSSPGGIGSTDHRGLDIAFPTGTKVLACESGKVTVAGWNGGFGKCIIIEHSPQLKTVYAHLSEIYVKTGQNVARGQVIGAVGNTGDSTGPHLHLAIMLNGVYVNPEKGWLSVP